VTKKQISIISFLVIFLGRDVLPTVDLFLLAIEESMRFLVNLKPSTTQADIVQIVMEDKNTHSCSCVTATNSGFGQ
jgi:hypothetical protein